MARHITRGDINCLVDSVYYSGIFYSYLVRVLLY